MARRRRKTSPHYLLNLSLSLVVLVVFALAGLQVIDRTSAATANPYGYADYCTLESNITTIYGWAADPNATSLTQPSVTINAGGKAATTTTNRAGYRDAAVNAWIDQNRTGDPKPGSYGFRAALTGLYKGTRNTITGTVLNEGPGSSVILTINNSSFTDGDNSKPFFVNNVIPEACLAVRPSTPPPVTTAPPPVNSTPTPPRTTPAQTPAPASTPPASNISASADAVVTAGTLAASAKIPAGNATAVRMNYGKNPLQLDQHTTDQPVSGADTTVLITGLEPAATYSYQIVRIDKDGKPITSPTSTFDTLGFVISLHFVDNHNQGIQGIPATLSTQNKRKVSDDQGNIQFNGLGEGSHSVSYTYRENRFTKLVTANAAVVSPTEAAAPNVVTIDHTINVEESAAKADKAAAAQDKGSSLGIIITVILVIIAIALVAFALIRKRQRYYASDYQLEDSAPPLPEYQPLSPPSVQIPQNHDEVHTGVSLKEMVMRSMQEEAHRRAAEQNQQNPGNPPDSDKRNG